MEWGISLKSSRLKNKVWLYFTFFSICILAGLWLFQVIFLNTYYEYQKTSELNKIALKVQKSYGTDEFELLLDELAFKNGVCIEIVSNNVIYSSNPSRGCISGLYQNQSYKKTFIDSNLSKKVYRVVNNRFKNKTLVYALKLDKDFYVFINSSLQPLDSTINILASQLVYVTFIVLALSFLIAYFVSKKLTEPIVKLKNAANKMSKGDYDVVFNTNSDIIELDELASTLNDACDELSKTDELRRELLANVSHDLKTPLTMIKAYAEMVRDLTYKDKKKREENLNTIIEETERLNILVNDILELSKIQSEVSELKIELFDLHDMIKQIIGKFKYLEETKDYKFIYENDQEIFVNADKHKIEQVIYNLIGNAVNYVGKDKIVKINLTIKENSILVEIIDHGKGIDKEELNLIWDKYYKVDKTYKRNIIGTGLGLSIVKNILIKHNFIYGVNSDKGKGSTFYFEIPYKKEK